MLELGGGLIALEVGLLAFGDDFLALDVGLIALKIFCLQVRTIGLLITIYKMINTQGSGATDCASRNNNHQKSSTAFFYAVELRNIT